MDTLVPALDPELVADLAVRTGAVSRRDALRKTALLGTALAASPLALAALSREAYGQAPLPVDIRNILLFALTLEHLEYEFYQAGIDATGLIAASETALFTVIRDHEADHVQFLQVALGEDPALGVGSFGRPPGGFDFTAGGAIPNALTDYPTFLALSQGFEDTGVRAYKGQAAGLMANDTILTAALQIHSVEARHASAVRRVRGQKGWITGDGLQGLPAGLGFEAIYAGDGPSVSVAGYGADEISESFDEPLTREQVRNGDGTTRGTGIADPFINLNPPPTTP